MTDPATGHRIIDLNELSPSPAPQPSPPIVNPLPPLANREEYVCSPTTSLDSYHSSEYSPMAPYHPNIPPSIQPSRSITPVQPSPRPLPQHRLRSGFTYENQIVQIGRAHV